ncbi:hypothetical protein I9W95_09805 [Thalassolituus marinus]|uniref:Uncharacterized protein n=2 Tax=Thalassolituus marinus TaxID=671053 RepID=A0ABS7ZU29_9GAMM|nr:hypothetical protein [Thalassolituus marinus]
MALKQLEALSTGLGGKTNVFIPNINDFKTNSFQQVVVFVPGIAATVERRPNDTLAITRLDLSDEYKTIERGSKAKPGVYSVSKDTGEVEVKFRKDGPILSENNRQVVIADPRFTSPLEAAQEAEKRLETLFSSNAAIKCDFDLFYSPLGEKLKGMRNYNAAVVNKTYAFAAVLANEMEQSRSSKGVEWSSERGGSVVFTQALTTLEKKGVSFNDQKHIVKMCWSSSDPKPAFKAATKMGMLADKDILRSGSHVKAALSATVGNFQRAADKKDPYGWNDFGGEVYTGAMVGNTLAGIGALGATSTMAALGSSAAPWLATAGTVTGTVGALQFIFQKLKERHDRG